LDNIPEYLSADKNPKKYVGSVKTFFDE